MQLSFLNAAIIDVCEGEGELEWSVKMPAAHTTVVL
jgi:hypothetical protein